jgi:hypothetical protein
VSEEAATKGVQVEQPAASSGAELVYRFTPGGYGSIFSYGISLFSNWTMLGAVSEVSPGQYQFSDPQATNAGQRFYRIRSN